MNIKRNTLTIFTLLFSCVFSWAQEVGTWYAHYSLSYIENVATSDTRVFASNEAGLFYFDKEENSTNRFTKDDGLSGNIITALGYDERYNTFYVGYKDGNIDIVSDDNLSITNINDIQRSTGISSSKQINHFAFGNGFTYISTDFGIVVYNPERDEIKESYRNIGPNGEETIVNSVMIDEDDNLIFSNNEYGLSKATIGSANLLDFSNWEYLTDEDNQSIDYFEFYAVFDNSLYSIRTRGTDDQNGIYIYNSNSFQKTSLPISYNEAQDFNSNGTNLIGTYGGEIKVYDASGQIFRIFVEEMTPEAGDASRCGVMDSDLNLWIGTTRNGLITNFYEGQKTSVSPNSPLSNDIFNFNFVNSSLVGLSGGYNSSGAPSSSTNSVYFYKDFKWETLNSNIDNNWQFATPIDLVYDSDSDRYFYSTMVDGIVIQNADGTYEQLTDVDSAGVPFFSIVTSQTRTPYIQIDNNRSLWITNHRNRGNPALHQLDLTTNEWTSYNLSSNSALDALHVIIGDEGFIWILGDLTSVVAYDPVNEREKELTTSPGQGALPSNGVNHIAKDRNGDIWVATDEGVAVFKNTSTVFDDGSYEASTPIFEQRPLLQDEKVNAIAVDGANRKWFGTTNGVFLFNETGTELIHLFNTENSLLSSNNVITIGINEETGEVFFGTNEGIVSYWSDASEPEETFGDAKIFPNPINPNFDGIVTINGLKEYSEVKITDISGALVYEQLSNGGTATWDGRKLNGEVVETGVYLVYATDQDFTESFIGKIVVTN